jgi:hypothetical protein
MENPLGGEPKLTNAFKNVPEIGFRREAHGSIMRYEGEPFKVRWLLCVKRPCGAFFIRASIKGPDGSCAAFMAFSSEADTGSREKKTRQIKIIEHRL